MYSGIFFALHSLPPLFQTQKAAKLSSDNLAVLLAIWRRGRDLNSRYRFKPVYSLSRRAPSADSDTSPRANGRSSTQNAEAKSSLVRHTCQENEHFCSATRSPAATLPAPAGLLVLARHAALAPPATPPLPTCPSATAKGRRKQPTPSLRPPHFLAETAPH